MKLDRVIAVRNRKTVYRDGDRCIKVFGDEYSKAYVFNEALNQARIEETGLTIPRVLEVTQIDGKWAMVSEYIKGKTLDRLMNEEPERYDEYMALFVDLQLNIHTKHCPSLPKMKDVMTRGIIATELEATVRYELHTRLESTSKHNKVCHGDYDPTNIIITESGTPYIVDWSHATQGNAEADAAATYLFFCLRGDVTGGKTYLDIFCERSGMDSKEVCKWVPIVAASLLARANEPEREILMPYVYATDLD